MSSSTHRNQIKQFKIKYVPYIPQLSHTQSGIFNVVPSSSRKNLSTQRLRPKPSSNHILLNKSNNLVLNELSYIKAAHLGKTRNYSNNNSNIINSRLNNSSFQIHLSNQQQQQQQPQFKKLNLHSKMIISTSPKHGEGQIKYNDNKFKEKESVNGNSNNNNNGSSNASSMSKKGSLNKNKKCYIQIQSTNYNANNNNNNNIKYVKKSITKDTTSYDSNSNTNTFKTKRTFDINEEFIDTPEELHFLYVHIIQNGKVLESNF